MKTNIKFLLVALVAFSAFSITSCGDDDPAPTPAPVVDNTIAGVASRDTNLSLLVKALTKANLVATLQGPGPFTVFAPTNAAFEAAGYNAATIDALPASGVPALKTLLQNHVVSGAVQSTGLVDNTYIKTLATTTASGTNGMSMYVKTTGGVKLNNLATVTTPNVSASNGVIHVVDKVITLPTVVDHAAANSAFTTLVSVLDRPGQPNFISILGGSGPFTVFAPTNAAFTALDTELAPGGIASVTADNITKVLQYHVINGNELSNSTLLTTNNGAVTSLLGQNFTVQTTVAPASLKLKDVNGRPCEVVISDVQGSNGVIHVLSRVLLPTL
jgi:uncharacterized surface protein with fasciclin (FAS1) repeats